MPNSARRSIECLQRINSVLLQQYEFGEAVAEQVRELTEQIARVIGLDDRLILGRAARVTAYEDPAMDDSAQVWIPALSPRCGLGVVLVDMHEFAYLQTQQSHLAESTHNQFLEFAHCTAAMRSTLLSQLSVLLDRFAVLAESSRL